MVFSRFRWFGKQPPPDLSDFRFYHSYEYSMVYDIKFSTYVEFAVTPENAENILKLLKSQERIYAAARQYVDAELKNFAEARAARKVPLGEACSAAEFAQFQANVRKAFADAGFALKKIDPPRISERFLD